MISDGLSEQNSNILSVDLSLNKTTYYSSYECGEKIDISYTDIIIELHLIGVQRRLILEKCYYLLLGDTALINRFSLIIHIKHTKWETWGL